MSARSPFCSRYPLAIAASLLLLGANHASSAMCIVSIEFIGQAIFPTGTQFGGTTVGGLSGIDYKAAAETYLAISDDRSRVNPARDYSLHIDFADGCLDLEGVTFGAILPDGRRSLIVVSDNNFSSTQFTQFVAFTVEVRPTADCDRRTTWCRATDRDRGRSAGRDRRTLQHLGERRCDASPPPTIQTDTMPKADSR